MLDNVVIHRSKKVLAYLAYLATRPRLRLLYGARYSPHGNPVERIWGALKAYQMLHTAAPSSSPWLPDGYGEDALCATMAPWQTGSQATIH